ncbi:MAG: tetratricopeptide repeat protein [Saprospiraceae bacterium]|nr:tetratricopeptide repeat protein [Saprospiraceae bacterium]
MNKISLLTQYLQESPDDPFLHFALAKEYENLDQIDLATDKYEYLMRVHESYVGTYYHAGKIFEKKTKWLEAMSCYEKGIAIARKAGDRHSAAELNEAKEQLQDSLEG